jgi:hypothetical protein
MQPDGARFIGGVPVNKFKVNFREAGAWVGTVISHLHINRREVVKLHPLAGIDSIQGVRMAFGAKKGEVNCIRQTGIKSTPLLMAQA